METRSKEAVPLRRPPSRDPGVVGSGRCWAVRGIPSPKLWRLAGFPSVREHRVPSVPGLGHVGGAARPDRDALLYSTAVFLAHRRAVAGRVLGRGRELGARDSSLVGRCWLGCVPRGKMTP